jgi:hypothetical protein
MDIEKYLKNKNEIPYIILLALIVLISPLVVRALFFEGALMGDEPYYHMRIAEEILNGHALPAIDALVYGERDYVFNPYHLMLAAFGIIFTIESASKILPFLMGMLSALLFNSILGYFRVEPPKRLIILSFFIFSPVFIYMFSFSTPLCMLVFLDLLGVWLFTKKSPVCKVLAIICLAPVPFFGLLNAAITALAILLLVIYQKEGKWFFVALMAVFLLGCVSAGLSSPSLLGYALADKPAFLKSNPIQDSLSLFGAKIGFSVVAIFLAAFGLVSTWGHRMREYYFYMMALLIALVFLVDTSFNIYLNFIIVILSAYGFFALMERRWDLSVVRDLTLFIIVLGIIFSAVSFISDSATGLPGKDTVKALLWLERHSDPGDIVVSSYKNGFWIEYYAQRPVVLDALVHGSEESENRYVETATLFSTRNLSMASHILDKYDAKYVLIDKSTMQPMLINDKKQLGLPFLMQNSEKFEKKKELGDIEVWKFRG